MAEKIWIGQVRVTVLGTRPRVWRRLAAPATIRLRELHEVIQIAMGWTGKYPHRFFAGDRELLPGRDDSLEEASLDRTASLRCIVPKTTASGKPTGLEGEDENEVRLGEVCGENKSRLYYAYEVGEGWGLAMEVQQYFKAKLRVEYPRCMTGQHACPPEDCGGVRGYYRMLQVLADPKGEGHAEAVKRLGKWLNPEAFDKEWVNARLTTWEGEKVYRVQLKNPNKKKKRSGRREERRPWTRQGTAQERIAEHAEAAASR